MTQLYLTTPDGLHSKIALDSFAETLDAALGAGEVAALLLLHHETDDQALARVAAKLGPLARDRGVAVLVEDRARIAAELDVIHLSERGHGLTAVRQDIGP